jgi:hypothetical protein
MDQQRRKRAPETRIGPELRVQVPESLKAKVERVRVHLSRKSGSPVTTSATIRIILRDYKEAP